MMDEETNKKKERDFESILDDIFRIDNLSDPQHKLWVMIRMLVTYTCGIAVILILRKHIPYVSEEAVEYIAVKAADFLVPLSIFIGLHSLGWTTIHYIGRLLVYLERLVKRVR